MTIKNYSQSTEQPHILKALSKFTSGKFLDIGAYDTFRFSNVRALYETGNWGGVLVEPDPKHYKNIADNYKDDPEIKVLNVAIGSENCDVDFYESNGDAVGTTDEAHMKKWGAAGVKYTKIKVPQIAVEDFFNEYGVGVNMLSIDTESTNIIVFRGVPDWVWAELSLLVIEHDGNILEINEKLRPFGFETIHINAENIILSKNK